jgi:hypothetical protein
VTTGPGDGGTDEGTDADAGDGGHHPPAAEDDSLGCSCSLPAANRAAALLPWTLGLAALALVLRGRRARRRRGGARSVLH